MKLIQKTQTHYCRSLSSQLKRRKKPMIEYFKDSVKISEKEFKSLLTDEFVRKYEHNIAGNIVTYEK